MTDDLTRRIREAINVSDNFCMTAIGMPIGWGGCRWSLSDQPKAPGDGNGGNTFANNINGAAP